MPASHHFPILLALLFVVITSGCASTPETADYDPWEGINRPIHSFNDTMDSWVLKPVAKGYKAVTPDPVETGVSNIFGNLFEVRNIFNDLLQWKWKQAGNDTGRFLINSTIGLAGFFDVARHMNLPESDGEDFGQTLAVWGVGDGPYLVLPLLGPSNLRDGAGIPVDFATGLDGYIDDVPTRNATVAFRYVVDRAELLNAEAFVSGDRYTFFREAYRQRRDYLINDGLIEDDFDDFGDFGDDFGDDDVFE